MNIGILTMEIYESRQPNSVGSSRIRGSWLSKYWDEAELYLMGKQYDAIIFQKSYFTRLAEKFDGIKILDICDPDWLENRPVKEMIEYSDGVICATDLIYDVIKKMTDKPVAIIEDGVDLSEIKNVKQHSGVAKTAVWFGYSSNAEQLDQVLATLKRLGLRLVVISEHPYYPKSKVAGINDDWIQENIKNVKYDYEIVNDDIIQYGDIVLNPRLDLPRFKYKGKNKTLQAWALGMPVAHDSDELEKFMNESERQTEAEARLKEVREQNDVLLRIPKYKEFIELVKHDKAEKSKGKGLTAGDNGLATLS